MDDLSIAIKSFSLGKPGEELKLADRIRSLSKHAPKNDNVSFTVSRILSQVRLNGDDALIAFESRFDKSTFRSPEELEVTPEEFKEAFSNVSPSDIRAIKKSFGQIRWLAKRQMMRFSPLNFKTPLGFDITEGYSPLQRVGAYVPRGMASYPSTVGMICIPALEAGVNEIALATPPLRGRADPAILVAAHICGVSKVIKAGGAQAIAAFAFGTGIVRKVDLIAGPGNEYVTEAKKQVSGSGGVSIDSLAGPTELLIVADHNSDSRLVFLDLISQAEHGNRTICGVVSDSEKLIKEVIGYAKLTGGRGLQNMRNILQSFIFSVKSSSLDSSLEFAEAFAPEHLQLMTSNPSKLKLSRSGLVLKGKFAPCSASDYMVGTSHVLPTGGSASRGAGISVETFLKRITEVRGSMESLQSCEKYISRISNLEGLPNHGIAATARFQK